MFRCVARVTACAMLLVFLCVTAAQGQVEPYGTNDYGGFRNILPPGTNGFDDATQLAQFEAAATRPEHSSDQLQMYSNLTQAAGSVTAATIPDYFKDATFGVPAGDVQSTQTPEPGVTIIRDSQFGVPHIYGDTRAELMFGIGYATAEDRLFFIDVLRHAGQGDLASFAGGANVSMDKQVWADEPYTQQDLVNQVNYMQDQPGGEQLYADATSYVIGINAYINQAQEPLNYLTMMPSEYAAIGQPQGPAAFTIENLVSIATLVGGIFGNGGGDQLYNAMLYEHMAQRFGPEHDVVAGSPTVIATPKKKKKTKAKRKAKKSDAAAARAKHKPTTTKKKKKAKKKPVADHSGFATFLSFEPPPTPARGCSSYRINREDPGASGQYDQSDAIRIMDAWWPLWVQAEFQPVLGASLLDQVESDYPINDEPGHGAPVHGTPSTLHQGSAFDVGFYGIVQKDLRSVLHDPETGKLNRVYCGNGSLASCRAALESSPAAAVAETPAQVYPADGVCQAGDQMCHDSIQFRAIGAITQPLMEWVNRPTFQQADEIQGHGPG